VRHVRNLAGDLDLPLLLCGARRTRLRRHERALRPLRRDRRGQRRRSRRGWTAVGFLQHALFFEGMASTDAIPAGTRFSSAKQGLFTLVPDCYGRVPPYEDIWQATIGLLRKRAERAIDGLGRR